jgi:hypothetical protein
LKNSFSKLQHSKIFQKDSSLSFTKFGIGSVKYFFLENFSISENNIIYAQAANVLWLFMYSRIRVNQSNLAREPGGSSQG